MNTLHQEIQDRLTLARHARRLGLQIARRFHVEIALDARRQLRAQ
jgi:hypothetical protein